MKIRKDFVTNSSSSSFILAFKDRGDIQEFKEDCESFGYEQFYEMIDWRASDFLEFCNETREPMPIRSLIDKLRETYDVYWGPDASNELNRLYTENYQLKPWEMLTVRINSFGEKEVDLEELAFEEIDVVDDNGKDVYTISIINNKENRNKEEILKDLRWRYLHGIAQRMLEEKFPRENYENYNDCWKARYEYERTQEYKDFVDNYVVDDPEYLKKKEMVENAELIVSGMVWDTNGGLLEWAIRNGFIEQEMRKYCVNVLNVG